MKMNQQVKEKWVTALRGGKYKQARGDLKNPEGFCCLGVLCDVFRKETGVGEWRGVGFEIDGNPYEAGLPDAVAEWSGVEALGRLPNFVGGYDHLAHLNDHARFTFNEIADVIEEQL